MQIRDLKNEMYGGTCINRQLQLPQLLLGEHKEVPPHFSVKEKVR